MIDANTNTQTLPLSTRTLSRPTAPKTCVYNVAMSATHARCLALYTACSVRLYMRTQCYSKKKKKTKCCMCL